MSASKCAELLLCPFNCPLLNNLLYDLAREMFRRIYEMSGQVEKDFSSLLVRGRPSILFIIASLPIHLF